MISISCQKDRWMKYFWGVIKMQYVLITGCSSGIGLETALLLKQNNHRVFATARDQKDVEHLKNLGFESFLLDLTKTDSIDACLNQILEITGGKLDVLFNNGAYGQPGAVEDLETEVLKEQFETNVFGWHELTRKVIKIMREQGGYGKIIQHSSILGIISLKFRGAYNASKYAIEGLSDTLRLELSDSDIKVVTLNTGPVKSRFRANALKMFQKNIDMQKSHFTEIYKNELKNRLENNKDDTPFTLPSSAVANIVLKILNSKEPKPRYYITTATYILGYLKRILSTSLLDKILNRI